MLSDMKKVLAAQAARFDPDGNRRLQHRFLGNLVTVDLWQ